MNRDPYGSSKPRIGETPIGRARIRASSVTAPALIARAEAASEAATAAIVSASQAAQATVSSWQEAGAAWSLVRKSCRRRGLETPSEVPISDLGGALNELAKASTQPYLGGRKEAWARWRARNAAPKVRASDAEAVAAFAGER